MVNYILIILASIISGYFGPMLVELAKRRWKKKIDPLNEAIKHNLIIDHQLDLIIDEFSCNRVWVAMFHNGGHFYPTGKSIQKFSVFHERITDGTVSIMDTFQNIPISLFPKTFSKLVDESEVHIFANESTPYDLNIFHKNYETKSMYLFRIEDLEGRFIGVLAIEYNNEKSLLKDEFIFIRQKLGIIGSILTEYLKTLQK